jgi:uncharacterized protein with PhoU and TrkA domain
MKDIEELGKKILKMKDTSELMIDLAYSALLYNNKQIAQEVYYLEDIIDDLYQKIQNSAVKNTAKDNPNIALTMIRLATSIEMIADSARGIADVVLRDIEPHPIVKMSIRESDVIISTAEVQKGSTMANCTLGGIRLASETGMWVIAVRREKEWIFGPDENTEILPGDILIARGPNEGEKSFRRMARSARGKFGAKIRRKNA